MKVPLFPLHTWLPDAHTEAPTAGSVLLAGVLLKVGAYGLIRFNLSLFPEASKYFATLVSILAVIGIIYGAVVRADPDRHQAAGRVLLACRTWGSSSWASSRSRSRPSPAACCRW